LFVLIEVKPEMLDELVSERTEILEREITELETQSDKLAQEITEVTGEEPSGIK